MSIFGRIENIINPKPVEVEKGKNPEEEIKINPDIKEIKDQEDTIFRIGDSLVDKSLYNSGKCGIGLTIVGFKNFQTVVTKTSGGDGSLGLSSIENFLKTGFKIPEARNFQELYVAIIQKGTIPGTQKFYTPGELIEAIGLVRKGRVDINTITRTEGLRDKVLELLQQ